MNNNRIRTLACLFSAAALATTAFVGITATVAVKNETVTYTVEKTNSSRQDIGEPGRITSFTRFEDVIEYYRNEARAKNSGTYGYSNIKVKGYDVLVVSDQVYSSDHYAVQGRFFIQKPGETVRCIGNLKSDSTAYPFSVDSEGIIYASSSKTYETYILSDDATNLEHKDYIQLTYNGDPDGVYWGYLNDSYHEDTRVEIDERGLSGQAHYDDIRKTGRLRSTPIKFNVLK